MTAAASGLTPETIRVATSTTVVIQATNRGPRTSTWSAVLVFDMMLLLVALCMGSGAARHGLFLAAPSAAREGAATQQLQQQQQPATRHRSTARRLLSRSSTRADTSCSLPNGDVIGAIAVPGLVA